MTLSPSFLAYIVIFLLSYCCFTQSGNAKGILLRLVPTTQQQLVFLKSLKYERSGVPLQFWRHPDQVHRHVDVWIAKTSLDEFQKLVRKVRLTFKLISKDIIVNEISKTHSPEYRIENYDHIYNEIEDITREIRRLGAAYKDTVSTQVIGKSHEGRPIHAVHIHQNASVVKPIVFLQCGTHSREWLAVASCQYVLRKLIFDQNYDEEIIELLTKYDIVMVPLLNPDGYRFTHTRSRMWRKSRSPTTNKWCHGVDINRNFDYRWGGGGSSPDPCNEIYCGEKPFSESESLALARYLYKIRRKLAAFMDVHTYGQMWMSPWGFTTGHTREYVRQEEALRAVQRALKEKNGILYKVGRSAVTLFQTSGNSIDWVYGRLGIAHTYGIELRPPLSRHGRFNGFIRSREEIVPSGEDLLLGLKTLALHIVL